MAPRRPSPVDCLGYPLKCCCFSLKVGSIIICVLSFMWALVELTQSDSLMATIVPKKGDIFKYCKIVHILITTSFLIATGVLLLGIMVRRSLPVHIYIWAAFIFNCINIALTVASVVSQVVRVGKIDNKSIGKLVFAVIWNSMFFYLLTVVNSYKITFYK